MSRYQLAICFFVLFSSLSYAGTLIGTIDQLKTYKNGMVIVKTKENETDYVATRPDCVNPVTMGHSNSMAFNSTTPGGRAILAQLLSARATSSKIRMEGSGACILPSSSSAVLSLEEINVLTLDY